MAARMQLSSLSMDMKRGPIRLSPRPQSLRNADYEDRFDFTTVFCDIFWTADRRHVQLVGPPLLNLQRDLELRVHALPSGNPCKFELRHRFWVDTGSVEVPPDTTGILFETSAGRHVSAIQPNLAPLFAGRRCIFTLSRNNDLAWIRDWAKFYQRIHHCNGIVIYDNGSDRYDVGDLEATLRAAAGGIEILVVSWPFPYGVFDGRLEATFGLWDSFYCQAAALEHVRRRLFPTAQGVVNADIDELVVCDDGGSVFDVLDRSATGYIQFDGWWIYSHPGVQRAGSRRHTQFHHRKTGLDASVGKWAVAPLRCDENAQWRVHSITGMAADAAGLDVRLRHFRAINTDWDVDRGLSTTRRTKTAVADSETLVPDVGLLEAFKTAFGITKSEMTVSVLTEPAAEAPDLPSFAVHLGRVGHSGAPGSAPESPSAGDNPRLTSGAFHVQAGLVAEASGNFGAAEQSFRSASRLAPDDPAGHWLLFDLLMAEERFDEAHAVAQFWFTLGVGGWQAEVVSARMWSRLGQSERTVEALERIAEAAPRADVLAMLARHQVELGRFGNAEETQLRAITAYEADPNRDQSPSQENNLPPTLLPKPHLADLYRKLTAIYQAQRKDTETEAALRQVLRLDPVSPADLLVLSDILRRTNREAEAAQTRIHAIALATKLLDHPPDTSLGPVLLERADVERVAHLAQCLVRADALEDAKTSLLALVDRWPDNLRARRVASGLLFTAGAVAEAACVLEGLIARHPDDSQALCSLSIALRQLGRYDAAVSSARRAADVDPGSVATHFLLGRALASSGRSREAAAAFGRALTIAPDHFGSAQRARHPDPVDRPN